MVPRAMSSGLGILGYDSYEFMVADLERSRRLYREMMDVPEVAHLSRRALDEWGEDAVVFATGSASCVCVTPRERGSRAERWLRRHPDGVSVVGLRVRDLEHTRRVLDRRGAIFTTPMQEVTDQEGRSRRWFDIATPIGDVRSRFVEGNFSALLEAIERDQLQRDAALRQLEAGAGS